MRGWPALLCLLAALVPAGTVWARPIAKPIDRDHRWVGYSLDLRIGRAFTDANGMIDHTVFDISTGPRFILQRRAIVPSNATPGEPDAEDTNGPPRAHTEEHITLTPKVGFALGLGEVEQVSVRAYAGLELALRVRPALRIHLLLTGGYLRALGESDDGRQGFMLRLAPALSVQDRRRIVSIHFEPIGFLLLPAAEGGYTRHSSHFAIDLAVLKFGLDF